LITRSATGTTLTGLTPFSLNVRLSFIYPATFSSIGVSLKLIRSTFEGASAAYPLYGLTTKSATGTVFGGTPPLSMNESGLLITSLMYGSSCST